MGFDHPRREDAVRGRHGLVDLDIDAVDLPDSDRPIGVVIRGQVRMGTKRSRQFVGIHRPVEAQADDDRHLLAHDPALSETVQEDVDQDVVWRRTGDVGDDDRDGVVRGDDIGQ